MNGNRGFDILLLDLVLGQDSTLASIVKWTREFPGLRIVVHSELTSIGLVRACVNAGVCGFVSKHSPISDLGRAIESAQNGERFVSAAIGYLADVASQSLSGLSGRTLRILTALRRGLPYRTIAALENISEKAVQYHTRKLRRALNLPNGRGGWDEAWAIPDLPEFRLE